MYDAHRICDLSHGRPFPSFKHFKADGIVQVISDKKTGYPAYQIHAGKLRRLGQVIWFARQLIRGD